VEITVRHTDQMGWQPSPSPTVWRKRLEHVGPAESGRVTSVVRYDPGSSFARHPHPDGEEILVLDGIFSDDRGDHPAGSYLLNPEGYEHAPYSEAGCILLVKLRQYAGAGRRQVALATRGAPMEPHPAVAGAERLLLYQQDGFPELMQLVRLAPGLAVPRQQFPAGEEIFVIEGDLADEHGRYRAGSWIKFPPGTGHAPRTDGGCLLYVKKGHL
jgi:anti-sigma factor ChrR (cupin superfamily)